MAVGGTSVAALVRRQPDADRLAPAPRRRRTSTRIAFAPSGDYLAVAYGNGTAQLLDARTLAPVSKPFTATSTGDGRIGGVQPRRLDDRHQRRRRDPCGSGRSPTPRTLGSCPPCTTPATRSTPSRSHPNGRTLAATSLDDFTRLWNVVDPARPEPLGKPLGGLHGYAMGLAFSPTATCSRSAARTEPSICGT